MRRYRPTDLPALFALDTLCFERPFRFSRAAMRRFAEAPNAVTLVAIEPESTVAAEQVAGFCIVHLEPLATGQTAGYVVTLDVAPPFRRQGLAKSLMRAAEAAAKDEGAGLMALHVFTQNQPAIRLYERLGYREVCREADFYGSALDAVVYQCVLDPKVPPDLESLG